MKCPDTMMSRVFLIRRPVAIAALLILALLAGRPSVAATVALPTGEPDPNCSDLRLWLRADAGVRDAAGHAPSDPEFSGLAATWSDQSGQTFRSHGAARAGAILRSAASPGQASGQRSLSAADGCWRGPATRCTIM